MQISELGSALQASTHGVTTRDGTDGNVRDCSMQHDKGLGAALLKDAFQRAINAAVAIAGRAIVVHAIDEDTVRFYEHFDFVPSPNDDRTLMILMKDVRAMLGA